MTSEPVHLEFADDEIIRLRKELAIALHENDGLTLAIEILKEFKAETEGTDWVYPQMKRALLSGIVASITKLENEAAKR